MSFHRMSSVSTNGVSASVMPVSIILFALLLLYSCSNSADDNMETLHSAPLRATEEVNDLALFVSDLELVRVGDEETAYPAISKVLWGEPVLFLSGGVVYSASSDFQTIQRVGNIGRGPGEYLSVKDIAISSQGDEIWCMDVRNSVLRYSLKTLDYLGRIDFQKDEREYVRAMIPQENNSIALYTPNPDGNIPQGQNTFYCLSYFNETGKEFDRDLPWTQYNVMASISNPVSVAADRQYVLSPESSNIAYVFDEQGINMRIEFDFGSKWIPSGFFNPKNGDPIKKVGDLFEMDCFKLISSIYYPGSNLYFHAYGKDSSSWNFYLSKDGTNGIRWKSLGIASPPIYAVASDGEYLYFPYDDYGLVEDEKDPLKCLVINKFGVPAEVGVSYLIKVKFHVK